MQRHFGVKVYLLVLAGAVSLLGGCASTAPTTPASPDANPNVHPGFDTWQYPGEAALRAWREDSPYRWVGYYLPAPCRRDSSWVGQRETIERLGWGMAVLYVGQQVFEGQPLDDGTPPDRIICSRRLLTPEQGRIDARDAIAEAAREGFAPGTIIYLDVERVSAVNDSLLAYYRAWTDELLRESPYVPGTYAHRINAQDLFEAARTSYRAAGVSTSPPFWITGTGGFSLGEPPETVGLPFADVWQGVLNVTREWGGVELRVDENTANRASPSSPAGR